MSSFFHILGVLFALAASGSSLLCEQCRSNSTSCSGPRISCPLDNQCGAVLAQSSSGISVSNDYKKFCAPRNLCNLTGSMSMTGGQTKIVSSCCDSDNCTAGLPSLPTGSSASNGLRCRICTSPDCSAFETMKCTGDENKCLLMDLNTVSGSPNPLWSGSGCATKGFCDFEIQAYSFGIATGNTRFNCTSGCLSLQKGYSLQAVIYLVLLKLLM